MTFAERRRDCYSRFAAVSDLPALVANLFVAPRLRNLDCANPIIIIRIILATHSRTSFSISIQIDANFGLADSSYFMRNLF